MLPLIIAAGGAALGAYQAKRQEDEARRAEQMNNQLAVLDTAYSPFVQRQGYMAKTMDRGPGVWGGAAQGAMSGFQTGQGISAQKADQSMKKQQLDMEQKLKQQQLEDMKSGKYYNGYQGLMK